TRRSNGHQQCATQHERDGQILKDPERLCSDWEGGVHRVAVTMADPAGIGTEIMLKAVERLRPALDAGEFALVLIGCFATYEATARALGLETGVRRVSADQLDQSSVVFLD